MAANASLTPQQLELMVRLFSRVFIVRTIISANRNNPFAILSAGYMAVGFALFAVG